MAAATGLAQLVGKAGAAWSIYQFLNKATAPWQGIPDKVDPFTIISIENYRRLYGNTKEAQAFEASHPSAITRRIRRASQERVGPASRTHRKQAHRKKAHRKQAHRKQAR